MESVNVVIETCMMLNSAQKVEPRKVSVIVLTKNSEETIEKCLESVRQNNPSEIVVIDGGSRDETLFIAKGFTDKIFFDKGRGLSFARQIGAHIAREDYVMYVDSDVILPPNTISVMASEMDLHSFDGIQAQIRLAEAVNSKYLSWALANYHKLRFKRTAFPSEQERIATVASLFRKECLLKCGFNLATPNADDSVLSYRMKKAGYKLGISSAFVYHFAFSDANDYCRISRRGKACAELLLIEDAIIPALKDLGFPLYGVAIAVAHLRFDLIPFFLIYGLLFIKGFVNKLIELCRK